MRRRSCSVDARVVRRRAATCICLKPLTIPTSRCYLRDHISSRHESILLCIRPAVAHYQTHYSATRTHLHHPSNRKSSDCKHHQRRKCPFQTFLQCACAYIATPVIIMIFSSAHPCSRNEAQSSDITGHLTHIWQPANTWQLRYTMHPIR